MGNAPFLDGDNAIGNSDAAQFGTQVECRLADDFNRIGYSDLFKVGSPLKGNPANFGDRQHGSSIKRDTIANVGVNQACIVDLLVLIIGVAHNDHSLLVRTGPIGVIEHTVNLDDGMSCQ